MENTLCALKPHGKLVDDKLPAARRLADTCRRVGVFGVAGDVLGVSVQKHHELSMEDAYQEPTPIRRTAEPFPVGGSA